MKYCVHVCMVPVKSHCITSCLLQDVRAGVSDDHTPQTCSCIGAFTVTTSSSTVAVNQRDDTPVSSSLSGPCDKDDCSAPPTPPSFTQVGGAPYWGETSACTNLSYIHPQTTKHLVKASARQEVGWAGGARRGGSWQHHSLCLVKLTDST